MIIFKNILLVAIFGLFILLSSCFNTNDSKITILKQKSGTIHETYNYWFFTKDGDKCYIFSFPISSYGDYLNRNLHYVMINHKNEVLIYGGRKYKKDSKVRLEVANVSIFFDTLKLEAWTGDDKFVINKFLDNPNSFFFVFSQLGLNKTSNPEDNITNKNEAITPELSIPLSQSSKTDATQPSNNQETIDKYALDGFASAFQSMISQCSK